MNLTSILALASLALACSCGTTQDKAAKAPPAVAGARVQDKVAPMPEDDLRNIVVRAATIYNRPPKKVTKALPYFVRVDFGNPTYDEIESISGDVVIYDGAGNEVSRTPVTLRMVTDLIVLKGRLLPNTSGYGTALIDKAWSYHTKFEIRSATYYPDARDYKDVGHLFALVTRHDNLKLDEMVHKDPSLLKVTDPKSGATMLQVAALANNVGVIDYLIGKGADFNAGNDLGTPVLIAAAAGSDDAALDLIRKGASLQHTKDEPPPLELAAEYGRADLIDELVKRGCDPNDQPVERANPLEIAARAGNHWTALALIKHGAKVNYTDKAHTPPIFHAIMSNNIEMVKLLLDNGADINLHSPGGGFTALTMAAGWADGNMVKFLLSKGADINAKDGKGKTAIDVAKEAKNTSTLEALQSAGGAK